MARVPGRARLSATLFGPGRHRTCTRPRPWPHNGSQWRTLILFACLTGTIATGLIGHLGVAGQLAEWCFTAVSVTVFATSRLAGRKGPAGGLGRAGADGPDGDGRPVPAIAPTGGWRALRAVSRLMPSEAGRRWRAEAESSLFEMAPKQRAAAVRSYLRSAPRVVAMTWGREVSRRTRRRAG